MLKGGRRSTRWIAYRDEVQRSQDAVKMINIKSVEVVVLLLMTF